MQKSLLSLLAVMIFAQCGYSQVHERWDVKTMTDGFQPSGPVKKITVAQIARKSRIGVRNTQGRSSPIKGSYRNLEHTQSQLCYDPPCVTCS